MAYAKSDLVSWMIRMLIVDVTLTYGLKVCRGELISNATLPTELQSEVLLPCSFTSDLLNSNRTEDTSVVWIQLSSTVTNIVEISLDGETKFWTNRLGRIKTLPKLQQSELLDFSIRISNLQQSDLGVYNCQLFRETNCFLAYKSIELHKEYFEWPWKIIVGSAGVGAAILVLIIITVKLCKRERQTADEVSYASVIHRSHSSHDSNVLVHNNLIVNEDPYSGIKI